MQKRLSRTEQELWNSVMVSTTPLSKNYMQIELPRRPTRIRCNYFNPTLDLHGKTINTAYQSVESQIEQAKLLNQKQITIITGKSGIIAQEFKHWATKFKSEWQVSSCKNNAVWQFKKRR